MNTVKAREFKGMWIPREIWLDDRLTLLDKVILAELDSLGRAEGCHASNAYLAGLCRCSERQISITVKKLAELGLIRVDKRGGWRRLLRSCLEKNEGRGGGGTDGKKRPDGTEASSVRGRRNFGAGPKDLLTINIENTVITNRESKGAERFTPPSEGEVADYARFFIAANDFDCGFSAGRFVDHYRANGWKVGGKAPMKDWRAAVRLWIRRDEPGRVRREPSQEEMERRQLDLAWAEFRDRAGREERGPA